MKLLNFKLNESRFKHFKKTFFKIFFYKFFFFKFLKRRRWRQARGSRGQGLTTKEWGWRSHGRVRALSCSRLAGLSWKRSLRRARRVCHRPKVHDSSWETFTARDVQLLLISHEKCDHDYVINYQKNLKLKVINKLYY